MSTYSNEGTSAPTFLHSGTQGSPETLQPESIELQDVHNRVQDLVGTLAVYVDQQFIAPHALPSWIAGLHHFDEHSNQTPEHRAPQRLAYLWLLDALIQSPGALVEAMIAARADLVGTDEALQPFAREEAQDA